MRTTSIPGAACTLLIFVFIFPPVTRCFADPILKPRKYHGPIPQRYYTLGIGFLAGAEDKELFSALDRSVVGQGGEAFTSDFGSSIHLDGSFTIKLHPQFAFRAKGGTSFLRSSSDGFFIPETSQTDTLGLRPQFDFDRKFNVFLFSLEASGMYYFSDASVDEFQPYMGGGFGVYVPRAKFEESLVDHDTGGPAGTRDRTKWSAEAGVHGMVGFLYHVNNRLALSLEARYQIAQSKFRLAVPVVINSSRQMREISFDIDYSGFIISFGVSRFF